MKVVTEENPCTLEKKKVEAHERNNTCKLRESAPN
jgi:hypothetical protein